ncbi:hypothetical protein M406DRAFT_321841 [Cryphonectria parasitica EP155]|uniref:VOC domain-containing protein n=1 Tax=Cryphonectria parasitica (strain ATCC 38755 / EP155) TaxID=660469 RepID=A0A9P5CRB3_CRYP1|nr:uncharacterized protein M406DRAFT_321841 [Cryphonectria parasitica EP155]KAF3768078.1 hypothetical protein M406DRAFT_321841 [Cryphonectria parasitica EP155]
MATEAPKKIQLTRISHIYYKYKPEDVDAARAFMVDFGFFEVKREGPRTYYRGYGVEPFVLCVEASDETKFGGTAFAVDSLEELERASKTLPKEAKATDVYEMEGAPGGGKCVTFYDPVDGFPFHLVYGQELVEPLSLELPEPKPNYPEKQYRGVNQTQRFQKRPAPVHKLGHFGLCVTNYKKAFEFYSTYFNFHPSELIHNDAGEDVTVFFRLGKGPERVDHHCFFFFEGPRAPHVHHSSFETHDFDAQVLGHDWLRHKGYENCWGVGRHIMGSQIFDYWFDPSKFILEHYVDGDLLDQDYPTQHSAMSMDNLHVWGPDLPPTFLS